MQKKYLIAIIAGGGLVVLLGVGVWYLRSRSSRDLPVQLPPASLPVPSSSSTPSVVPPVSPDLQQKAEKELESLKKYPVDSDVDGLSDELEKTLGTDPHKTDSDNDGRSDSQEYFDHTDPLKADAPQARGGFVPEASAASTTMSPSAETGSAVTTTAVASVVDTDRDGLSDEEEGRRGTDPLKLDTDGDSLGDGDEVNKYKTDPLNADTDADGYKDADEVKKGYNPLGAGKCAKPDCIP